jgi:hypothetical protein
MKKKFELLKLFKGFRLDRSKVNVMFVKLFG